jgi:hypothetical protein
MVGGEPPVMRMPERIGRDSAIGTATSRLLDAIKGQPPQTPPPYAPQLQT